jgi:hypothetical protein
MDEMHQQRRLLAGEADPGEGGGDPPLYAAVMSSIKYGFGLPITGTPFVSADTDVAALLEFMNMHDSGRSYQENSQLFLNHSTQASFSSLSASFPVIEYHNNWLDYLSVEALNEAKADVDELQKIAARIQSFIERGEDPSHLRRQYNLVKTYARIRSIISSPSTEILDSLDPAEYVHMPKIIETIRLLLTVVLEGERVAIVSRFTSVLRFVMKVMDEVFDGDIIDYVYYHGGMSRTQRDAVVKDFKDDTTASRAIFLSADAAGVGLNLVGEHMIVIDGGFSFAKDEQVVCRFRRMGQQGKTVHVWFLRMSVGVEKDMWISQHNKLIRSMAVNHDNTCAREVLRDVFDDDSYREQDDDL